MKRSSIDLAPVSGPKRLLQAREEHVCRAGQSVQLPLERLVGRRQLVAAGNQLAPGRGQCRHLLIPAREQRFGRSQVVARGQELPPHLADQRVALGQQLARLLASDHQLAAGGRQRPATSLSLPRAALRPSQVVARGQELPPQLAELCVALGQQLVASSPATTSSRLMVASAANSLSLPTSRASAEPRSLRAASSSARCRLKRGVALGQRCLGLGHAQFQGSGARGHGLGLLGQGVLGLGLGCDISRCRGQVGASAAILASRAARTLPASAAALVTLGELLLRSASSCRAAYRSRR